MNRPRMVTSRAPLGALAAVLLIAGIAVGQDLGHALLAGGATALLILLLARVFGGDWSTMSRSRRQLISGSAFTIVAVVASAASSDEPVRQGLTTLVVCAIVTGLGFLVLRNLDRQGRPPR